MSGKFIPPWFEGVTPAGTFRSLFKWGSLNQFKHPNRGFYQVLKDTFSMTDADFQQPLDLGLEPVPAELPTRLSAEQLSAFERVVGVENLRLDACSRLAASYGAAAIDLLRLRQKIIENVPDAVVCPRNQEDVAAILQLCREQRIPLNIYGGGSSVTRGTEAVLGGVTLDLSVHMNRVLSFNATDQTITVEAGMSGPQLEEALNNAPERFGAPHRYTCGHFPQSFEYSSVGGWVVTRGAGQNSTYYGKIEDIVICQEYVTPRGILQTKPQPRAATGPDIDQIMIGSEGVFGVLTAVTLRIFRLLPQNTRRFSFLFKSWEDGQAAVREVMQAECGYPSVFRLSDPEETDVALHIYHIAGTLADSALTRLGYKPMQRCLLLGSADGENGFTANIQRSVRHICRGSGAFNLSAFGVTHRWEKDRFRDPYMREDLQDFGILIDTLECGVTWSQMALVHQQVRAFVKSRPQTICMTHVSHCYPQGANLYFIFICRYTTIQDYLDLVYGVLNAIQASGAALSHHHGIGKQTAPWLEEQIGTPAMDVIRVLKAHFDPEHILNPGGTLGLDMSAEQKEKRWSKDLSLPRP
jgi:alkyldihydroxyacetonephosphate synthase